MGYLSCSRKTHPSMCLTMNLSRRLCTNRGTRRGNYEEIRRNICRGISPATYQLAEVFSTGPGDLPTHELDEEHDEESSTKSLPRNPYGDLRGNPNKDPRGNRNRNLRGNISRNLWGKVKQAHSGESSREPTHEVAASFVTKPDDLPTGDFDGEYYKEPSTKNYRGTRTGTHGENRSGTDEGPAGGANSRTHAWAR